MAFQANDTVTFTSTAVAEISRTRTDRDRARQYLSGLRMTVQRVLPNGRVNVVYTDTSGAEPSYRTFAARDLTIA